MAKKSRKSAGAQQAEVTQARADAIKLALAEIWELIAARDIYTAETRTSALLALPLLSDGTDDEYRIAAAAFIAVTRRERYGPEGAAFLRMLISLGPRVVRREASDALADFTADGIYPPEWVATIGKPAPGRAYQGRDVYGDEEVIIVTFSYEDDEHALLVGLDLSELPTVVLVSPVSDVSDLLKLFEGGSEGITGLKPITLAEARRRIEAPLTQAGQDPDYEIGPSTILALPFARSRVRRLPAPDSAVSYTAADRAAAVDEFLDSRFAAEAGDPEVARFWAQVLTGYSGRVPDEPPASVGRHKLGAALLVHVPATFTLSDEQRDGIRPAVTAWVRWAAERQGLDEAATGTLRTHLATLLDDFPAAYGESDNAVARGYVRDLAAPDADVAWLADCRARRGLAVSPPDERDPDVAALDATNPDDRQNIAAAEFAACVPARMDMAEFLPAALRVVEELWHDEPASTWQQARKLLADGHDPHDVIHLLAETPAR